MNPRISCAKRSMLILASIVVAGFAMAGCDGGGNGGPANDNSIIGKVVDTTGSPVPGGNITAVITGSGPQGEPLGTTLAGGDFRIGHLFAGTYTVTASTTVGTTTYTGSSQAVVSPGTIITNCVIEVAPTNQQGVIEGQVKNTNGQPVAGVDVLASVKVNSSQGNTGTSGMLAVTDQNGNYEFPNVPTATVPYTLTATALGFTNGTQTVTTLTAGQTVTENFQLAASSNSTIPAPSSVLASSFTQPSDVLSPAIAAHAASSAETSSSTTTGTVYDTIRKVMSPKYAQLIASGKLASKITRLKPQISGGFGTYAVEADVFFDESSTTEVAGYRIYNSAGSQPLAPYDFLQDPFASEYVDIDPNFFTNTTYNFAVSAINTNDVESSLSATESIDPLNLVSINTPTSGQALTNPATISWQAVDGATSYGVFIYNTYPSVGSSPTVQSTGLTGTSFTPSTSLPAGSYWLIVSATDQNSTDVSVSQITQFSVQ